MADHEPEKTILPLEGKFPASGEKPQKEKLYGETRPKSVGERLIKALDLKALAQRIDEEVLASGLLEKLDRADAPSLASRLLWHTLKVDGAVLVDTLKEMKHDS